MRVELERLWRRKGPKVPLKQPMKSRLWLSNGSCIRLRPQHVDYVWSYDFVHHRRVQPRVYGDQSEDKAQFDECDRRPDGLIHRSRCSNLHTAQANGSEFSVEAVRQGIKVVGAKSVLYRDRARVNSGERLLREI